ncbi:hypothetical protein BDV93DRAFT_528505 [Ceratobasidium sp. AG-I]|nr:hypothetical protein BDV93DRAFT_528505 [Ceratobasidium sp. AG-I]
MDRELSFILTPNPHSPHPPIAILRSTGPQPSSSADFLLPITTLISPSSRPNQTQKPRAQINHPIIRPK